MSDEPAAVPGRDIGVLLRQELGMHIVREQPDGSWEWIYYGRWSHGERFHVSDRFLRDLYAYFSGEEWKVTLAKHGQISRTPTELDVLAYFEERNQHGERID
jgi:hypothetical protein